MSTQQNNICSKCGQKVTESQNFCLNCRNLLKAPETIIAGRNQKIRKKLKQKAKNRPHCGAKQKSVSDLGSTLTGAAAMTAAEAAENGVLSDLWESIIDSLF